MFEIKIKTNFPKLEREMNHFAKKQIPYVTARTLTQLAKNSQTELRKNLGRHFEIRNDYTARGIKVDPARKHQWPYPRATVGSTDEYMARQELGGIKEGKGGKLLAQPKEIRPDKSVITKRSQWPSRLLQTPGYFQVNLKNRPPIGMALILYRRPTSGRGATYKPAARKVQLMYVQTRRVEIKFRWSFRETVKRVVTHKAFSKIFGNFLSKEIKKGIK